MYILFYPYNFFIKRVQIFRKCTCVNFAFKYFKNKWFWLINYTATIIDADDATQKWSLINITFKKKSVSQNILHEKIQLIHSVNFLTSFQPYTILLLSIVFFFYGLTDFLTFTHVHSITEIKQKHSQRQEQSYKSYYQNHMLFQYKNLRLNYTPSYKQERIN